jgi:hypothetical protein
MLCNLHSNHRAGKDAAQRRMRNATFLRSGCKKRAKTAGKGCRRPIRFIPFFDN